MHKLQSKRDYGVYIYGLDMADIEYTNLKSEHRIMVSYTQLNEIEIMKDQLLASGVFSTMVGETPSMPVEYDLVYETNDICVYKVLDPSDSIFKGRNPHIYQYNEQYGV